MPAPSNRGKAKSKKNKTKNSGASSESRPDDADEVHMVEIDNAEGWGRVVKILCDYFELPDLATRSGLKKVHTNFNMIYARIDNFYEKNLHNDKIRGAIIGIYAKMCVDALLRNKLFDKGIMDKIMPLLNIDETRHFALRALNTITNHGGVKIRVEIAKNGALIAKLLRDLPDDEKVADLSISILAHCVSAAFEGFEQPAHPTDLKDIDLVDIIKTTLETAKRPHSHPRQMLDHTVELLVNNSLHGSSAYKQYTPAIGFLVAGMRSKDWTTRAACLGALLRLYHVEGEEDQRHLDPNRFITSLRRGVPKNINDILMTYGPLRCETYLTLSCTSEFQKAMLECVRSRNLYALGLKQVDLLLKTEFALFDGGMQREDPRTGKLEIVDVGLPFKMWAESLPHCARAIREKKNPKEEVLADILDVKYSIMKQRLPEAVDLAKQCVLRYPDHAYFYYAISLSGDFVQGLGAAKKGMKCKTITPFVKYQMMHRAVTHAGEMGMRLLQETEEVGDKKWEEGIAFLTSAYDDAKTYVGEAPPDNRYMKNVCYWLVLLTILFAENINPDLRELQHTLERLKIADEYSEFIGIPPPKTNFRLAQQAAVKYYASGMRDFSRVFAELDKSRLEGFDEAELKVTPEKVEDDLATWLEGMRLDDGTMEPPLQCGGNFARPKVRFENVTLYRCSWCGNPSVALKKCSGCEKTRYCDSRCQKLHWSEHKKTCKH
ncbi:hypothetical protein BDN70DRAFT_855949 [Pholiota conissans]|uniref:MYND-type domain-containing protein n=1 Tax=Pholiota conissans TaxID=109636 RepID=A0A9P5Z6D1_9AGAR|nr:hypothetical protein BDN70DRAFT_855949 [Pholiota conissans]